MFEAHQQNFVHFISHEVKGWLTKNQAAFAAIAQGDLGDVPEEVRKLAEHALEDTRKGVSTLSNILNAHSLSSGAVIYNKEPFDIKPVMMEIVERRNRMLRSKQLVLKLSVDNKPCIVVGDMAQIRDHVLRNLIDNSIEYTKRGIINISVMNQSQKVIISVKDSGVGISASDMKNLFTQGGRGKNARKIKSHSTGFGLYIAKQIVDAHDGRIWAESEGEGKGSAFYVEFQDKTMV